LASILAKSAVRATVLAGFTVASTSSPAVGVPTVVAVSEPATVAVAATHVKPVAPGVQQL